MPLKSVEKADLAYAMNIQKLYLYTLQTEARKKMIDEWEMSFRNLESETLKLENELKIVSQWLREVCRLQECETRIESTEKIFSEVAGDMYQFQSMLRTVNQEMNIANSRVPLYVLRVTDTSRDKFISIIHELSKIRNEIISIVKPSEKSFKDAAMYFGKLSKTIPQLRLLIKECCAILPSVSNNTFRALSLQTCVKYKDRCVT